jgi:ketosteroid isomerase-like protein
MPRSLVIAAARNSLFTVIAVALAACAGAQHTGSFAVADRASITAVVEGQTAAWNRGDLAGYMDGYARTPSLIFTSGGHLRRGWQETFDRFKARYATDPKAMGHLAFTLDAVDAVGPASDAAIVVGHWNLTDTEHAGHGVFTLVFERRPEGWRIVHDHTSTEISP